MKMEWKSSLLRNNLVTRILIIRFSSIGDIVLTTSFLRQLKEQWEGEVELHFLVKKKFVSVLAHNPRIFKIHSFESSVAECYEELVETGFDYIFDLQANLRSSLVKRKLKSLSFTVDKRNFAKYLWVKFGINGTIGHIVDRYRATAKLFSIKEDHVGLEYYLSKDDEVPLPTQSFVTAVLGATHMGKRADARHWINWLGEVNQMVILLGGESEIELADEIAKHCEVINWTGKLTLGNSAYVISRSEWVIAGDTGLMHIAAAFKKNIISLWGCTRPSLGMGPWLPGQKSIAIQPLDRTERPCSKLGNRCRFGWDNKCMHQINGRQIKEAIAAIEQEHRTAPSAQ
jgi:ADP-heptose:LPS heptosyltransferase